MPGGDKSALVNVTQGKTGDALGRGAVRAAPLMN